MLTIPIVLAASVRAYAPAANGPRKPILPKFKVDKYMLENGLTVVLHEDHKTPLVAVNVMYNVGSKDDPPGRSGFAHLFEHLMFEGSEHANGPFRDRIALYQYDHNATTSEDWTVYYETVTANALELVLWLEADRMGFLPPAITQEKLDVVRSVVKNERRSRYDNVPFGAADAVRRELLYPPEHPYRRERIGSMADLSAARFGDVRAFFARYYVPNNACLCLAGDFPPDQARRWIDKYFGSLARGPANKPGASSVPALPTAKHITLTDRVRHARAELVWPTAPADHADEAALDVLASVLGGLPSDNRLWRRLMYEEQLAAQVDVAHPTFRLSGDFRVTIYAQPGQPLANLVRFADSEIERLKAEGPTDAEVRRAQIERERSLNVTLESLSGKAGVLCRDTASHGDPFWHRAVLEKVWQITPQDVRRVARRYLGPRRIRIDVVPGPPADHRSDGEPSAKEKQADANPPSSPFDADFDRSAEPKVGQLPRFTPPHFRRRALSNGLSLRIIERHEMPLVTIKLVVRSGETSTPPGKEGLCTILATLLDEGTKSRSALQIADELADVGATLTTEGWLESLEISLTAMTQHLDHSLDLYTDVILNPSFPPNEVERLKLERLAELDAASTYAERIADNVFDGLIYPREHPYARPFLGTISSIRSITRDDAIALYRKIFVPGNAELVIVGDVNTAKIVAALEARLGKWPAGPLPAFPHVPDPVPPANQPLYLIDRPGATQSVVIVGVAAAAAASPDWEPLSILNTILGGSSSGRVNWKLRDEKGYTYGITANFSRRRGPAPFTLTGPVETAATKDALAGIIEEMSDFTGERAITDVDVAETDATKIPVALGQFETNADIAFQIWELVAYNLRDDYYEARLDDVVKVSKADLDRVAGKYLKRERLTILIVGDRSQIEGPLRTLPFVKSICMLDANGNPVPDRAAPQAATAR